jgi:hypothetical protein
MQPLKVTADAVLKPLLQRELKRAKAEQRMIQEDLESAATPPNDPTE